jgi:hypothetical protein
MIDLSPVSCGAIRLALSGIIISFLISCGPEEAIPFAPDGCLIDFNYSDRTDEPCKILTQNCTPIEVEGEFFFVENARKYLPQSCLEIGDKLFFENEEGAYLPFVITSKDHAMVRSTYASIPPCGSMPQYCFRSEYYSLEMKSDDSKYHLEITLEVYVRGSPLQWIQRDGMYIRDHKLSSLASIFYLSLYGQVSSANEFYPTYQHGGRVFYDVYSVEPPNNDDNAIKIFYNSDYGMVAFIDGENMHWTLVI